MLLGLVAVISLASIVGPARGYLQQRSALAALRSDIATRSSDAAHLRRQVGLWDDPAYVRAQARSRLHVVMPGETGYVLVGPATVPAHAQAHAVRTSAGGRSTPATSPSASSVQGAP